MDQVSFILLMLLLTLLVMFIKYLFQLYKDRGELSLMVSQPVEEWVPGEYELPEYFHYSTDSQKEDCPDLYTECGIYQRPGLHTLTENPLYNRTFNLMPPQHSAGADQRRVQFSVKRHNKTNTPQHVPVDIEDNTLSSSPQSDRLEVAGQPRRDSYAAPCLTCELITMGSASPYADNSCPQCGKIWSQ